MNLSTCVKENLLELHFEDDMHSDDEQLITLISHFPELKKLTLARIYRITPMFPKKVKNEKLKFLFIRNCTQFNVKRIQEGLESVKSFLSFTLHIYTKLI